MTATIIIVIVLLIIVLILNGLFLYLEKRGNNALGGDAPHVDRDPGLDEATAKYLELPKSQWTITSNRNKLNGWFVKAKNQSDTTVILVHGFAVDHDSLNIHAQMFHNLGYNVLQIDNQAAGASEGKYMGFGYLESIDLKAWTEEIVRRMPDEKIVLFGASMGAATVMLTSGMTLPKNVKAVIEESGYTSTEDILSFHLKDRYKISGRLLLKGISVVSKIRAGYYFGQADCRKALANNHLPMLFMHGKQDYAVPYFMRDELMAVGDFPKVGYSSDKGVHIRSYYTDSARYQATVSDFLNKYL
ncbi:alpha/beta hydrolase [Companilactobacillus mishanensis]|uniref:Alpha/beta hydrolase n=1 Tax=Companilactobacillus mishanensis TaxID=2486008 RepID=A0A5P0ZJ36_9LACO|nr:alpha/beta hydrolase [Companilactobacillus mishanensis]MQS44751.1 alpha/beta hydrolase [Companilactobacillus mishanensis]MQS53025.1 alpha/beta hydrolase [Companilactobacillus mishanensis]